MTEPINSGEPKITTELDSQEVENWLNDPTFTFWGQEWTNMGCLPPSISLETLAEDFEKLDSIICHNLGNLNISFWLNQGLIMVKPVDENIQMRYLKNKKTDEDCIFAINIDTSCAMFVILNNSGNESCNKINSDPELIREVYFGNIQKIDGKLELSGKAEVAKGFNGEYVVE